MFNIVFKKPGNDPSIISFRTMRRMIGFLGISLPVILFSWSVIFTSEHFLLDSISSYYHTFARDIFVGILCAVSFFMFAYHGYDKLDFITFKIAGLSAAGIALFPAFIKSPMNPYIYIAPNANGVTNAFHFIFAGIFFSTLAFVSLFLFTKTDKNKKDGPKGEPKSGGIKKRKKIRNGIFIVCGSIILFCILCMFVLGILPDSSAFFGYEPVFWVETVSLFSFGISWLVKGELIFKDK